MCIIPFIWRDLQNSPNLVQELQCVPRDVDEYHSSPFFIAVSIASDIIHIAMNIFLLFESEVQKWESTILWWVV